MNKFWAILKTDANLALDYVIGGARGRKRAIDLAVEYADNDYYWITSNFEDEVVITCENDRGARYHIVCIEIQVEA